MFGPAAELLPGQLHAGPGVNLLLSVIREVVGEARHHDVGQQPDPGAGLGDHSRWQRRHHRGARLGRVRVNRPDILPPDKPARLVVDLLGHFLPNLDQTDPLGLRHIQDDPLDRQSTWRRPASAATPWLARGLRRGRRRLRPVLIVPHALVGQFQLLGVRLLRTGAVEPAPQIGEPLLVERGDQFHLAFQPGGLSPQGHDFLRQRIPLRSQGGEVGGVGRSHVTDTWIP